MPEVNVTPKIIYIYLMINVQHVHTSKGRTMLVLQDLPHYVGLMEKEDTVKRCLVET